LQLTSIVKTYGKHDEKQKELWKELGPCLRT